MSTEADLRNQLSAAIAARDYPLAERIALALVRLHAQHIDRILLLAERQASRAKPRQEREFAAVQMGLFEEIV